MSAKQISPQEALALMEKDGFIHLDVRTVAEFEAGHPTGSYNVPVMFRDPASMMMVPNPDFLRVVEANFSKDAKIVVGCRSGGRSGAAQMQMLQAGYETVVNQRHGWDQYRTPEGEIKPGWSKDESLPTETGSPEGRGFADLQAKAQ